MPRNLEIKARLSDPGKALVAAQGLGATSMGVLHQCDTYFDVPRGRLKLREFGDGTAELISYHREEDSDQRESNFHLYRTQNPAALKEVLAAVLGVRAVVRKKRTLYLHGKSRIHIDEVESLGNFVEFEVPSDGSREEASETMKLLLKEFQIAQGDFIRCSYVDLLLRKGDVSDSP